MRIAPGLGGEGGRRPRLLMVLVPLVALACSRRTAPTPAPGPIVSPRPEATAAAATFRQQYPGAGISFDAHTGQVKQLTAFVGPPAADPTRPEESARAFLTANAALFGLPADGLPLEAGEVKESPGARDGTITGRFVRFRQLAGDLPVHEAELVVHLTASSRVRAVHSAYRPLDAVSGAFKISREAAIERARQAMSPRRAPPEVGTAMVVFPRDRTGVRAWRITLESWVVIIDGDSGAVLVSRDEGRYASALVFPENPTVNNNTTTTVSLARLGTSTTLTGSQFSIINDNGPQPSATQDFLAAPSSPNFDDQMAYFHMEGMVSYFAGLGVAGPSTSLTVRTRVAESLGQAFYCNAKFIPASSRFMFGIPSAGCDGGGCLPPGQFADVICHEYTHFVLTVAGITGTGVESNAIHEGTSDYFSASRLGNACGGEGLEIGKPCYRDNTATYRYPTDMDSDSHAAGSVWASALWALRTKLGASVADRAISAGLMGNPADPTFDVYAGNILSGGAAYYLSLVDDDGWANLVRIFTAQSIVQNGQKVFCDHGIAAPFGSFVDLSVVGAAGVNINQTVTAPAGMVVDTSRGCRGGFDILAPSGWQDLKYFQQNRSRLPSYAETLGPTSLNVTFSVPGGCAGINTIALTYRLYTKPAP